MAMDVRGFASGRNEQAEVLVDFVLRRLSSELEKKGRVDKASVPARQVEFVKDDSSDVFDHRLDIALRNPIRGLLGVVQLWCQTTCYRGNDTGQPEPNKTYEIRETLIEALFLRSWLASEGSPFRTLHFTLGPAEYAYRWFKTAKENSFDRSLYIQVPDADIFECLAELLDDAQTDAERGRRLGTAIKDPSSAIGAAIRDTVDELLLWIEAGMQSAPMADKQAQLICDLRLSRATAAARAIQESKMGGEDIKPRAVAILQGDTDLDADQAMARTLDRLSIGNPFLAVALKASQDWRAWANHAFTIPPGVTTLKAYVRGLWMTAHPERLIVRRLLVRIHSDDPVRYVQDLGVRGVTERNLYDGNHGKTQTTRLVEHICAACMSERIATPDQLSRRLRERGRQLLRAAHRAESVNGSNLKPSSYYVLERISDRFAAVRFREADLPVPRAYHSGFGGATVRPYQNLEVITTLPPASRPLAILKTKYFREQEFPRRAKEEGYVGLTTTFELEGSEFVPRYPSTPLIMFVDMDASLQPPEHAIRRLSTCGWDVFFSIQKLVDYLEELERGEE